MEEVWNMFDALFKTAHAQGRRIEELENRILAVERRLAEQSAELSTLNERNGLRLVDEVHEEARAS